MSSTNTHVHNARALAPQIIIPPSALTTTSCSYDNDSNDNSTSTHASDVIASYASSFTISSTLADSTHSSQLSPSATSSLTDDFHFTKYLGRGASGSVYKVQHKRTQTVYALKTIYKQGLAVSQVRSLVREQSIMRSVSESDASRRFLELLSSWSDTKFFYILMPLCPTTLEDEVFRCDHFKPDRVQFYMTQLILAIKDLHKMGIVHRDIKPSNILISPSGHPVIADFGLSHQFDTIPTEEERTTQPYWPHRREDTPDMPHRPPSELTHVLFQWCGSPETMAPELFNNDPYSYGVDFWALAVTMYFMIYGRMPWWHECVGVLCLKVLEAPLPLFDNDGVDETTKDFLRQMLAKNPSSRLPIAEIENHPYFDGADWDAHQAGSVTPPWIPRAEPDESKERIEFEAGTPYDQLPGHNPWASYDYCSPAFQEALNAPIPSPSPSKRLKSKLLRLFVNRSTHTPPITSAPKRSKLIKSWWVRKSPWAKKTTRPVVGEWRMDLLV